MVVVITLNYNQNKYTLKCIESLLMSKYKDFKVFLIDNGSTPQNFDLLKGSLMQNDDLILKRINKNIGYVGGINYGLEKASLINPDFYIIMNNDTIIDEHAIEELVETCQKFENKSIVTGKVYHYDEPKKLQDIGYCFSNKNALEFDRIGLNEIDIGQFDQISERDLLDDVFWLFPSNLYKEIGGYSPYFWFSAEQADFALRAKKLGYKLIYTPNAKLWHKGSVSLGGRNRNPKLAYWHVQSTLIFRYRHLTKIQFMNQYFKTVKSVFVSYIKILREKLEGKQTNFDYANAKWNGLKYFNKWFFIRNENTGINTFKNK